ncbi:MAG: hypothetical protein ACE5KH_04920 [Candidatus Geothermarchaeales archaeon]
MGRRSLLAKELRAINVGIELFYETLKEQGVEVVHVAWKPRPELEEEYEDILSKIL